MNLTSYKCKKCGYECDQRRVSVDEKAEMHILGKRIHEIKEAIFKCG